MKPRKMVYRYLVLLLVVFILAFGSVKITAYGSNLDAPVLGALTWQQVNTNGFGDPQTAEVTALAEFKGNFFAGNFNLVDPEPLFDGAQIFKSPDGINWTALTVPGFGIAHDIAPPAILDLTVFNGYLYASTGRGDGPGQVWRSPDGIEFLPVIIHGFSDPDNVDIAVLTEFNGKLYAGVKNLVTGAWIYSSFTGDSNSWSPETPPVEGTPSPSVTALTVFDGGLYAAVESEGPAQIWYSNGGPWTVLVSDGFGVNSSMVAGMAVFNGSLYVGAGNVGSGAQLWRTTNGIDDWTSIPIPAFTDANNLKVEMVFVYEQNLFISLSNAVTGVELWRTPDGTNWEQVNLDGFGDSFNISTNRSNAAEVLGCQFYFGTVNIAAGGELWRTGLPCKHVYLPLIRR